MTYIDKIVCFVYTYNYISKKIIIFVKKLSKDGVILENNNIGKRLKYLREVAGLNQQQVADVISKNRSTYAYYETGTTTPKVSTLRKIASLYNLSLDELIDGFENTSVLNAPEPPYDGDWNTDERINQLSKFEQAVLLKVRLMTVEEKQELIDYLSNK